MVSDSWSWVTFQAAEELQNWVPQGSLLYGAAYSVAFLIWPRDTFLYAKQKSMKHTLLQSQFSLVWVFFPAAMHFTFVYNRNKAKKIPK